MKAKFLIILYFVIGSLYILFHYLDIYIPMIILKSLIIPVLIIYFLNNFNFQLNKFKKLILFALIFSWFGDILLMFTENNELFFMLGLVSFLTAHVFYIIAFINPLKRKTILRKKPLLFLPFLIYGAVLIWILFPDLESMALPVIIYACVILFMTMTALDRYGMVNRSSFLLVFIGAILFTLSDTQIAIDKFTFSFEISRLTIMSTYILAQYLIIQGCIQQE